MTDPRPAPQTRPITVAMALYQGAAFLEAQLESIAAQGGGWRLIVSDDGSTDAGPAIVATFAARHPGRVHVVPGPRLGAASNFRSMLRAAPTDAPVALADQDDVWLPGKLDRALSHLARIPADRPALYCSRVVVCDRDLIPTGQSRAPFRPSFRHALVQNLVQGNTAVLNPAAVALVQAADPLTPAVVMHDWWLYQLIAGAGGAIVADPRPTLLYRQHGGNVVGANGSWPARAQSFGRMLAGTHRVWSARTIAALAPVRHLLTEDSRRALADFATLHRGGPAQRIAAMRRGGFRRQGIVSQGALWLAAALGRI